MEFRGKKSEVICFRASASLVEALDELAQSEDRSRAYVARQFVEEGLSSVASPPEPGIGIGPVGYPRSAD